MTARHRVVASQPASAHRAAGVALLALLLTLALGSVALMAAVDVWAVARQRALESDLLFVGDQYRLAIQRYYFGAPPGTRRILPASLADLLKDDRYPMTVRHLRRLYPDPITGSPEWGLQRVGERIVGVYSLSEKEPIKQAGFPPTYEKFNGKSAYRDWVFSVNSVATTTSTNTTSTVTGIGGLEPVPTSGPATR